MKQLVNNWLKNSHLLNFRLNIGILKQTIFKQHCLLCASSEANNQTISLACLADLPWYPRTSCPQCDLASSGMVSGSCLNNPPDFDGTISVFLYAYPVNIIMLRYKYGNMLNLGDTFGEFLAEKSALDSIDFIIPMPMYTQMLKEPFFNQALEISKVLTKNCKEKLDYKV